jgi:D-arabinose 1-dehydrogenase-like Zn-dependent alcohol dehydrogenase
MQPRTKATAALVVAPGAPMVPETLDLLALERDAMLLRIEAATLCGTDVGLWHSALPSCTGSNASAD